MYLLNILKSAMRSKIPQIYIFHLDYYARNINNALRESIKRAIAIIQPCISSVSLSYFTFRAVRNKKNTKRRKTKSKWI